MNPGLNTIKHRQSSPLIDAFESVSENGHQHDLMVVYNIATKSFGFEGSFYDAVKKTNIWLSHQGVEFPNLDNTRKLWFFQRKQ